MPPRSPAARPGSPPNDRLRVSPFTVLSPPFVEQGAGSFRLALATRTGAVLRLPVDEADAVDSGAIDLVSDDTRALLRDAGIAVDRARDELGELLTENRRWSSDPSRLYECILPSSNCQLGCDYCGQSHRPSGMCEEAQDRLVERVSGRLHSGEVQELHVCWFGAEPLLGLDVIRALSGRLLTACDESGCSFGATIVTNGLRLSVPVATELLELGVRRAEVTLDGTADAHDARRGTKSGHPTFDRIVGNLVAIAAEPRLDPISLVVRCNVDGRNATGVPDLIDRLARPDLARRVSFYVAPVHDWSNTAGARSLPAEEFARLEIEWLARMIQRGLAAPLMPERKPVVCVAVNAQGTVTDPDGRAHRCTEHVLVDAYAAGPPRPVPVELSAGPASSGPADRPDPGDDLVDFYDQVERGHYDCSSCPMLPVCGGACPKAWLDGATPCPSAKLNLPERLVLAYAASRLGGVTAGE
ncbi:MAG: radical SAM protein [Acidimicrobiales bacterium]